MLVSKPASCRNVYKEAPGICIFNKHPKGFFLATGVGAVGLWPCPQHREVPSQGLNLCHSKVQILNCWPTRELLNLSLSRRQHVYLLMVQRLVCNEAGHILYLSISPSFRGMLRVYNPASREHLHVTDLMLVLSKGCLSLWQLSFWKRQVPSLPLEISWISHTCWPFSV